MRIPILFLVLCGALLAAAQPQQVKITNVAALENPVPVRKSRGADAALQAAGITAEQQDLVKKYGDPDYWPSGIRNDSARKANAAYIQNYACFRVAEYPEDSVQKVVVMIPAKENIHMPEEMRPLADIYLLLPASAITTANTGKSRPEISRGPRWKNLPAAKIIKPDDLYGTYELGQDTIGLAALRTRGMSQAEIDAVVFRSTERNWPDGIDTFDERYPKLSTFKKYKCFVGARWDDKVLLIVPVEKNKKMPELMRPYVDLYFVYARPAVEIKEKKR